MAPPAPPIAPPGDLSAPMGELQPVEGVAAGSSGSQGSGGGGGGWFGWLSGGGGSEKPPVPVRGSCAVLLPGCSLFFRWSLGDTHLGCSTSQCDGLCLAAICFIKQ